METLTYSMNRWTTEDLIGEVVRRTATDGQALRLVEGVIIRARLAAGDRLRAEFESWPGAGPAVVPAGPRGTTEMGLADDGERAGPLATPGHEVDAATSGAHAHDHAHGKKARVTLSAHEHPHLHRGDVEADGQLNGHTHARAHAALQWEVPDPA